MPEKNRKRKPRNLGDESEIVFNVKLVGNNASRVKRLLERTEATDWTELFASMTQYFEHIIKRQDAVFPRGGTLFLVARYPDGKEEAEQIFGEGEGRPRLLHS